MNKFLAAALQETELPDDLRRGLIGMCLVCPDDGVLHQAEAWADIYMGERDAFPADGIFQLRKRGLLEIGLGRGWSAIFRVARGRLRGAPDQSARKAIPTAVRRAVVARDGNLCAYCGTTFGPFDLDHVVPVSRGGEDTESNLVVACASCNRSKSDRLPEEWLV